MRPLWWTGVAVAVVGTLVLVYCGAMVVFTVRHAPMVTGYSVEQCIDCCLGDWLGDIATGARPLVGYGYAKETCTSRCGDPIEHAIGTDCVCDYEGSTPTPALRVPIEQGRGYTADDLELLLLIELYLRQVERSDKPSWQPHQGTITPEPTPLLGREIGVPL